MFNIEVVNGKITEKLSAFDDICRQIHFQISTYTTIYRYWCYPLYASSSPLGSIAMALTKGNDGWYNI